MNDILFLEKQFKVLIDQRAFDRTNGYIEFQKSTDGQNSIKEHFGLKRKSKNFMKQAGNDQRIFPNYFAPILVKEQNQRILKPMRYRVRPHWAKEEVPSEYNLFNARLETLTSKKTWRPLLKRNHAILAFQSFFEWVERHGRKTFIRIQEQHPQSSQVLLAPCLYDQWQNEDGQFQIESFAIITKEPTPEVLALGHDRCPIIIDESQIDSWLTPHNKSDDQVLEILKNSKYISFAESNYIL